MMGEDLVLPEILFPRETVFDGGKVVINFVSDTSDGLNFKTIGWLRLEEEKAKKFGFDWMDHYVYALRDIHKDSVGTVNAKIRNTTRGLYERLHSINSPEDIQNLEMAMPVAGCVVLLTTEVDGSHKMVLQTRMHKDEYQNTLGVSAGGIIKMQFNESGFPEPIERIYPKAMASVLALETGVSDSQSGFKAIALVTELRPKAHQEIVALHISPKSGEEIIKDYTGTSDLICLPFEVEVIEKLVTQMESPIPPTHLGALVACGYMRFLEDRGAEEARAWMTGLQQGVADNYNRIDGLVKRSGVGDRYMPSFPPTKQGLPELLRSLLRVGMLKSADRVDKTEAAKKFTLEDVCVVGSVMFKDYAQEGTPDNLRGRQAIESLVNVARIGGRAAVIIAPNTDSKFKVDLEHELEKLGDDENKNRVATEIETQRGYSAARRQAVNLARSSFPGIKAIVMQEIEKDLTEAYGGFLLELSKNKILVMMNRGVNAPYAEYPWLDDEFELDSGHIGANLPGAQFWGERDQNIRMANQEAAAFGETRYWDRLNGTRVMLNEEVSIGGVQINPVDLSLLQWEYADGYTQEDRKNKMNAYSEAVYNMIPVLESLGGGSLIEQVPTRYWHSEKQRT